MNKDEMKMIEDNKREETAFEAMIHFDGPSIPHLRVVPSYRFGAKTLYDANCRILADDEFLKNKIKQEAVREILQELYDEAMRYTNEVVELTAFEIKQLAKEKGIKLED